MDYQEAVEMIRNDMKLHHDFLSGKYRKALNMAIFALEKQIPKPLKSIKEGYYNVYCPTCGHDVGMYDAETGCAYMENKSNPRMCAKCGQLLFVKLEGE